jgi:NAD(P)-dependent dehydrogenase (short-subunit alcohol dehydrogenase family)
MLLQNKIAVVYGAGGAVGAVVSKAFARHGATVVLAGRSAERLAPVLASIEAAGGQAEAASVDVTDQAATDRHAADIAQRHGRIDISFNCIGLGDSHGEKLSAMAPQKFFSPVDIAVRGHFFAGNAVARQMQGSGVLLTIIANAVRRPHADIGGFGVACAAIGALYRQFAVELGPRGIRVLCLMSSGSPDSAGVSYAFDLLAKIEGVSRAEFERKMGADTLLGHLPSLAEVADAAVLMASDQARGMTSTMFNVTCGQIPD